jgi:hypothetical protein
MLAQVITLNDTDAWVAAFQDELEIYKVSLGELPFFLQDNPH